MNFFLKHEIKDYFDNDLNVSIKIILETNKDNMFTLINKLIEQFQILGYDINKLNNILTIITKNVFENKKTEHDISIKQFLLDNKIIQLFNNNNLQNTKSLIDNESYDYVLLYFIYLLVSLYNVETLKNYSNFTTLLKTYDEFVKMFD